ncbi:MAG: SH3 domain-containing protein [Kiritimatiellaceae bacterium]|nr:SH3 domain-containing protein [Kiritimatiellaceae bacterium]
MKKRWLMSLLLLLASLVLADKEARIQVTGNRVSLRSAPELNSVLLGRAMNGDLMTLQDSSNPDWFGVRAPESVDVWVNQEFVENNKVMTETLNIRSGPSLNHGVIGVASQDDILTFRGQNGEWIRIAPTKETVVWISRKYSKQVGTPTATNVVVSVDPIAKFKETEVPVPPNNPTVKKEKVLPVKQITTVVQPEVNAVMIAVSEAITSPGELNPDPDKTQGELLQFSGRLKSATGKLFKLVNENRGNAIICYVRGNAEQMKLYENGLLTLTGKTFWAINLDAPILVPVKLKAYPIIQ